MVGFKVHSGGSGRGERSVTTADSLSVIVHQQEQIA